MWCGPGAGQGLHDAGCGVSGSLQGGGSGRELTQDICVLCADQAALSVGIKGPSGEMIVMVPRNSKIPAEARHMIMLDPAKHITTVSIDVYQGESEDAADNQWLGCVV